MILYGVGQSRELQQTNSTLSLAKLILRGPWAIGSSNLPKGNVERLIVYIHGGPYGIRDFDSYDFSEKCICFLSNFEHYVLSKCSIW